MIQIERFFENIFIPKEITPPRLEAFARDHLGRLKGANPAGIYNGIIAATEPLINTLYTDLSETNIGTGSRKGNVAGKKLARTEFTKYLAQKEGLIRSTYGKKSFEYIQFFPSGINAFRHATDESFNTMCKIAVELATTYQAALGSEFATRLGSLYNAFAQSRSRLLQTRGELSHEIAEQRDAKTALQLQLMVNICTIGIHNAGNPRAAKQYFAQHLLFPAKRHHLFKAKVEGGTARQVCTFKYSEGKRFHIMNTGAVPLHFQMSLNGNGVGRAVDIKPAEKLNEPFGFFSSAGDSLQVSNETDKRGSYMVWEIT